MSERIPSFAGLSGPRSFDAPLIGRGPEMRELRESLGRALATKEPQTVTVIGGSGVGKTRLVQEFLQQMNVTERRIRSFRGVARSNGPSFGVIQRILRSRFGIIEGADQERTAANFREAVSSTLGDQRVTEFLHFMGAFLDLRFPGSPFIEALEEDPTQFSRVSQAVLRRFIEVDGNASPLVLTFEDLHNAHDDSLDLIQSLIRSMRGAPILMIVVARPELLARRADWGDEANHSRIELAPLPVDAAASLMYELLSPIGEVPEDLVEAAVDVAGGSPYLLQQMVRAFFESGTLAVESTDAPWTVDLAKLERAELPLTVEDAITARISSLASAERELLEKASTMGGVFWLGSLVALNRHGADTPDLWGGNQTQVAHVLETLSSLQERDYILELPDSSIPGEREFAFKHNLERETLHRLSNKNQMSRFHRLVAEWLEFRLKERHEEQFEMLAYHYEEGGVAHRAAGYYLRAGDRARDRFANHKAAEYYEKGLALIGDHDVSRLIDAYHHYGDVLQLSGRNDDALAAFRQMLSIAYRLDLRGKGGAAHNRIGRLHRSLGRLDEAMRHLGTGHALFDSAGDKRGVASSLDDVGKVHWMRGGYEAAERFMLKALVIRKQLGDLRSVALSSNNLGLVYQDSGKFDEALSMLQDALELRRQIDDRPGIAQTLNNLGTIHSDNSDHEQAVALFEEALLEARVVGDRMRQAVILTNLGESHYRLKKPAEAITVLRQAEDLSASLGDRILEGEVLRGLSKAHLLVHDHALARDYVARSIALFERARGKPFLAVALRTAGEIAGSAGWGGKEHLAARQHFNRSIEIFEELGNDIELARSCEAFAAFLRGSDEPEAARQAAELSLRGKLVRERLKVNDEPLYSSDDVTRPNFRVIQDPQGFMPHSPIGLFDEVTDESPETSASLARQHEDIHDAGEATLESTAPHSADPADPDTTAKMDSVPPED